MDPLKTFQNSINSKIDKQYKGTSYTDCYVAFLDILGMKTLVENNPYIFLRNLFNIIEELVKIYSLITVPKYGTFIDQNHLKYTIISDSIVLSIDANIDFALSKIVGFSSCLIQKFIEMPDYPVFLRGGITRGDIFHDDKIVFGPGLIDAYKLEENEAEWMRCIISKSIYSEESFKKYIASKTHAFDRDPNDGFFFIKFIRDSNEKLLSDYVEKVLKETQYSDSKSTHSLTIYEKYKCLHEYIKNNDKYRNF